MLMTKPAAIQLSQVEAGGKALLTEDHVARQQNPDHWGHLKRQSTGRQTIAIDIPWLC